MDAPMCKKLAALRAESGLTQEEVANRLGITKAAVSKWECGQSMPDISLLPAIADLYSTSIDDIFDHDRELDSESVNAAYQNALTLLGEDYEAGIVYVRQQTRYHWACAEFLHMMGAALFAQIPKLPGFGGSLEGEALLCAEEAERITRRAMELSSKETASLTELPMLTRILLWTGREREAERVIEDHVSKTPNLQAGLLAQLYRETGRREEAVAVLQRALLVSLLEAQAAMASMAPMVDNDRLDDLAKLGEALQPDEAFVSLFPTLMSTIRLQKAKNFAREGSVEEALRALELFVDALDGACSVMPNPVNPGIFDKVEDMLWAEADEATADVRADAVAELRVAYAASLETEEAWAAIRDDERFAQIISRVSGHEGRE